MKTDSANSDLLLSDLVEIYQLEDIRQFFITQSRSADMFITEDQFVECFTNILKKRCPGESFLRANFRQIDADLSWSDFNSFFIKQFNLLTSGDDVEGTIYDAVDELGVGKYQQISEPFHRDFISSFDFFPRLRIYLSGSLDSLVKGWSIELNGHCMKTIDHSQSTKTLLSEKAVDYLSKLREADVDTYKQQVRVQLDKQKRNELEKELKKAAGIDVDSI
ncbi:MAG: hypothetical protein EZS28_000453 [Streblomastix strix]|uniref:Uncharacterized protein n=1 Tax=Streblomastix strix TaxID=222440 RepID=A0A5J4XAT0_9EUKA|nr:MAG: hypothetical protein EZS28_000453 [Streblomastix strix]